MISEKIRKAVIDDIADFARSAGLIAEGVSVAPIRKGKNVEYVMMLKKESESQPKPAFFCNVFMQKPLNIHT